MTTEEQTACIRGYIEGYYGKLFSWKERHELVQALASLNLNTYCYAPKEDPQHRFKWREPYSAQWHQRFNELCASATDTSVEIVAGIAPGLDFTFSANADFDHLQQKTQQFLQHGATNILLLWDDIDDDFSDDIDISEGTAHASTVNKLSAALDQPLWTVPRVYAAEIENKNHYLEDFFTELDPQHTVLLCGAAIVASNISHTDLLQLSNRKNHQSSAALKHRTAIWDNFYANDYCPRRLFIGPWTGRDDVANFLINPTGMPYTDRLILDIATSTHATADKDKAWKNALKRHGVPAVFLHIAPYFLSPCFGDRVSPSSVDRTQSNQPLVSDPDIDAAIEDCLWKWKSPLAREWYPFIMSLKHDLALERGSLPIDRILKTQSRCLSARLLKDT